MGVARERPLRVLAADDSAVMRGIMHRLFAAHAAEGPGELPAMELCGVARDGVDCLEAIKRLQPDVLVLDLEMPRMNGLEVLESLRTQSPGLPVIMCSAHTVLGARSTLEALARGAADYVMKPTAQRDATTGIQSLSQQLLPKIAALLSGVTRRRETAEQRETAPLAGKARSFSTRADTAVELLVIGLSTGGPSALEKVLPELPEDFPVPVLIVQHMPKLFTGALAERLDRCCALRVQEAYDGAQVLPGTIWLAPGDSHMEVNERTPVPGSGGIERWGGGGRIRLHQQEPLNHCRPAVDYLFFSAARMCGAGTLALVMTGMGADGLNGSRAIFDAGGVVLAQDEATSAVWGMPKRVAEAGIASATLPVLEIADALKQRVSETRQTRFWPRRQKATTPSRGVMHGMY